MEHLTICKGVYLRIGIQLDVGYTKRLILLQKGAYFHITRLYTIKEVPISPVFYV